MRRRRLTNSHSYSNSYCLANSNAYPDGYADTYIYVAYSHGYANTDGYADSHIDSNAYCHADGDGDGNWNSKRAAASYSNPAASTYTQAAPVVGGESCLVRRSPAPAGRRRIVGSL